MSNWEVVTAAGVAIEEFKHRQQLNPIKPAWFTDQNIKLFNLVRVLFLP